MEHVRRPGAQARPRAEDGDAGDRARRRAPRSSTATCRPCCARRPATCGAAGSGRDGRRARRAQGADPGRRAPDALHPPRHAAARRSGGSGRDKDKGFHRDGAMTPQEFAERYVDPAARRLRLPRPRPAPEQRGRPDLHRRAPRQRGRGAAGDLPQRRHRRDEAACGGQPSSAASRCGSAATSARCTTRSAGIWDATLYDYDSLYGHTTDLGKADRLLHQGTAMTHAMLFTGVDVVDGTPRRWRVENSWGDEKADKGFWTMNDSWFAEHVFEIAVRRDALPAELRDARRRRADRAARLGPDGRAGPLRPLGDRRCSGAGGPPVDWRRDRDLAPPPHGHRRDGRLDPGPRAALVRPRPQARRVRRDPRDPRPPARRRRSWRCTP